MSVTINKALYGEVTLSANDSIIIGKNKYEESGMDRAKYGFASFTAPRGWALAIYAGVADGEVYDIKYQISLSMNSEEILLAETAHFLDKEEELITEPRDMIVSNGVQFIKISVDATSTDDIQVCWRRLL